MLFRSEDSNYVTEIASEGSNYVTEIASEGSNYVTEILLKMAANPSKHSIFKTGSESLDYCVFWSPFYFVLNNKLFMNSSLISHSSHCHAFTPCPQAIVVSYNQIY